MKKWSEENVFSKYLGKPRNIKQLTYLIKSFPKRCKYAWQRIDRGYSDLDLDGFDEYLQSIMSSGIRVFAERTYGYPDSCESFEEWQKELNDIADLIEKFNPDKCVDWDKGKLTSKDFDAADEEAAIAREVVFDWFKENFCSLWD